MITRFEVLGFKRFHQQSFDFLPLTVLTGMNGAGKSSLIQSVLLVWEASVGGSGSTVRLNDTLGMDLGTAEDVRNWKSGDLIELHVSDNAGNRSTWSFGVPSGEVPYLSVKNKPANQLIAFSGEPRSFAYLSAERLGPRSVYKASSMPASMLEVGVFGEHCAQILYLIGETPLDDGERLHPTRKDGDPRFVKYEVERWLSEIARPVELDAVQYSGSTLTGLRFRAPGGEWVKGPNMGFGVSYALPIILAGLTAKRGGLLLVENPEAHLHPAGQSRMGVFLGWLAGRGVQVVLETHSDHVLNGIRRAIGEFQYLDHDKAAVHFFGPSNGDELSIHKLGFTTLGSLSNWPKGFFDQYQTDVGSLGRIRRRS